MIPVYFRHRARPEYSISGRAHGAVLQRACVIPSCPDVPWNDATSAALSLVRLCVSRLLFDGGLAVQGQQVRYEQDQCVHISDIGCGRRILRGVRVTVSQRSG